MDCKDVYRDSLRSNILYFKGTGQELAGASWINTDIF